MKRLLTILAITLCLSCALTVPAFAEEDGENISTDITDIVENTENPDSSETQVPPVEDLVEPPTAPEETDTNVPDSTQSGATDADDTPENDSTWDAFVDKITNSSLWISIGTYVLSAFALYELFKSKFSGLITLVKGKASAGDIKDYLHKFGNDIGNNVETVRRQLTEQLAASDDANKKLMTILSIFMTNVKINDTAKAEILQVLSSVKEYTGTAAEIVETANAAIEAAQKTVETTETPALDAIKEEQELVVGGI